MKREKVYLVDKNNKVIGSKWRDELTDDDCWRVIAVWIVDTSGKILLQQRSFKKKVGPGIWSAACEGTIEFGDEPLKTAVRELREELGIITKPEQLKPTTKIHYKDPQFGWRIKYGYFLEVEHKPVESLKLQEEEVEQAQWMTSSQLEQFYSENPEKFPLRDQYEQLGFIN